VKVNNDISYKLIFSIYEHYHLGVLVQPYVVAYTSLDTLSLTYQKVFSGNASYYTKLTDDELAQIATLDNIMEEHIVRKFSPKQRIRPKEYFQKHFDKAQHKAEIRPYIETQLQALFAILPASSKSLYLADDINPAHRRIYLNEDFTKVLFHFRKNENGTAYFITIKYGDERIPFMKQGGLLLTSKPARLMVHGRLHSFYDFVDGNKLEVFLNKKHVYVQPENEHTYYSKFIKPLLETAPVFAQGFEINTVKEAATPKISLVKTSFGYQFKLGIVYGTAAFSFHQDKLFHVDLHWQEDEPIFTKYKRSRIWEANRVNALKELGLNPTTGSLFTLQDNSLLAAITWIRENSVLLTASHFIVTTDLEDTYSTQLPSLNYTIGDKIDWFDLEVIITIDSEQLLFSNIVKEMKKGRSQITLQNGHIFLFPKEWFTLGKALSNSGKDGNTFQVKKYQIDVLSLIKSKKIKEHLNTLVDIKEESPHKLFKGKLRPYQNDGLSWLMFLKNNNFGGILADDMGLGKTIQTLAFLQRVKQDDHLISNQPSFLLVAPTSLLYNWVQEIATFTPDLSVAIHSGPKRAKHEDELPAVDILITTYGLIRNDIQLFRSILFETVVLDESQNIKNHSAKTTQFIQQLTAKCRIALTGTPIENTVKDLWSQMNFLNKGLLGSLKTFEENFAKPIEKQNDNAKAQELQKLVKPFLLRRTKSEVAKDLPPLTEKIVYCKMTESQAKYYEEVKSEYRNSIVDLVEEKGLPKAKFSILQGLSKLRQIANHPVLTDKEYTADSGKHIILLNKIKDAISDGHKVLVFSQFVRYLNLLEKDINTLELPYFKLTGSTTKEKRALYVAGFQATKEATVFLISLKAGGIGLNLTSADYVFIVDPWWNPAAEAQARDRSHRIGQKHSVFSYKFIAKDTIEEKITALQARKQRISKDIIVSENSILSNLDINELQYLLA
jgi:superfamily II DNA or RNA helicase